MSIQSIIYGAFIAAIAVSSASAQFLISENKMTHNQAVMYCSGLGTRLADVTTANRAQANEQLAGKRAWIASWDYNFYNNACLHYHNGHVQDANCAEENYAACNAPILYKSGNDAAVAKAALADVPPVSGARASRKSRSSRRSRHCESSSSEICDPAFRYEYVYLTNTLTSVATSVATITSTSATVTSFEITATVAAFVVTTAD